MILFPPQLSGAATPKRLEMALPVIKKDYVIFIKNFLIINMATLSSFGWTDGLREIWGSTPRLMDIGRFLARYGVQP